ncbi:MAG: hypothetical protein ACRD99_07290 [Nitrososphaera sp.]
MSGKKVAIVAIPVAVAAIALAALFALPSQMDLAGKDSNPDDNSQLVPASAKDCSTISPRVETTIANGIGEATDETRAAANTLVEQYCQRPELVREISAMANPALGLVAYACDSGSGKIGDSAIQETLAKSTQVYCDSALIVILEDSEQLIVAVGDYREQILNQADSSDDPEMGRNSTNINVEEAEAKLQEASSLATKSNSLARAGQLYEAAQSLDNAIKLVDSISKT